MSISDSSKPVIIVPDLHGEINLLERVLGRFSPNEYNFVFLGDLIDRGPDSPAVVETVRQLYLEGKAIVLLGNHEDMMLRGVAGHDDLMRCWIENGGVETLNQYRALDLKLEYHFTEHYDFLRDHTVNWTIVETPHGNLFCSHATRPTLTQIQSSGDRDKSLVWVDDKFLWGRPTPNTIRPLRPDCIASVHGHTPQVKPYPKVNLVKSPHGDYYMLDIGSCFNGKLAVLDTSDLSVHTFSRMEEQR